MSWLSVVGIGEDGLAGLGQSARDAIGKAEIVFGGARHLELAAAAISGEARPWLSPFSAAVEAVIAATIRSTVEIFTVTKPITAAPQNPIAKTVLNTMYATAAGNPTADAMASPS